MSGCYTKSVKAMNEHWETHHGYKGSYFCYVCGNALGNGLPCRSYEKCTEPYINNAEERDAFFEANARKKTEEDEE